MNCFTRILLLLVSVSALAQTGFHSVSPGWTNVLRSLGLPQRPVSEANVIVVGNETGGWPANTVLIIEGDSALGRELGFKPQTRKVRVRKAQDAGHPDIDIVWERAVATPVFDVPKGAQVYCRARPGGAPLVAGMKRGNGAVLWTAVSIGEQGFERFPFLPQALAALGVEPPFAARRLWAFFDYGYRYAANPDTLAPMWRAAGINALHVGAWEFFDRNAGEDEYLRKLIAACHRNSILVYAWLEPPHISDEFWKKHPKWREKTALLKDAYVPWRKLMNLADPDCERAAFAGIRKMMALFDWDGVNLAELYFDGIEGVKNPVEFTPMNDLVRADFKRQHGFDPLELFRGGRTPEKLRTFLDYRAALCARIQERWVAELDKLRQERPGLDLVLTYVDDQFDTKMRDAIGADAPGALKLLDRYPMTFIIEDPATVWHLGPERYSEIARRYRPLTRHWERMGVDINVVERYQKVYPTKKQAGAELMQLIRAASEAFPHPMFYFEFSILPADLPFLPAASAVVERCEKQGGGLAIESPYGVGVRWKGPALVDGQPWPVHNAEWVWLPAGKHTLTPAADAPSGALLDFNGEIRAATVRPDGVAFEYTSDARALATFDRKPVRLSLDGQPATPELLSDHTIRLPSGQHKAEVGFQ